MKIIVFFALLHATFCGINDYSDDFVRNTMYPLASAAHAPNPQLCLTNIFGDGKLQRQLTVVCDIDKNDHCSGYTAYIPSKKVIVLSFRGAHGAIQEDLLGLESWEKQDPWIAGGKVNRYLNNAFFRLWNGGIKEDLLSLMNKYPDYNLWVTGHSMGAALASLGSSYVVATSLFSGSSVKLVTFGQPRVGDKVFAKAHDAQIDYQFRVNHWCDPAPHSPRELVGRYYHHKYEAFYLEDMLPNQYTLCEKDEDPNCSDGIKNATNFWDHLYFFGQDVRVFGDIGCLWNNTATATPPL